MILKDFHYIFQNVIAARQKDLELDFDYNFFSFKLSSSIISNQFFRKSIFDWFNDIDLFDLKIRSFFSFNKHVSFKQFISKQIVNSSKIQSFRNYEKKYQNDFFIRNNAIKRFFWISNMTEKNEKSINFYKFLTLHRDRECRINWFNHNHFWKVSQDQNKQSQNCDDHEKSIKIQRQKSFKKRDQREKRVKNFEKLVQFVRIKNVKWFADLTLNHHFRQQLKRHELRVTIQNDNAKHSKNNY